MAVLGHAGAQALLLVPERLSLVVKSMVFFLDVALLQKTLLFVFFGIFPFCLNLHHHVSSSLCVERLGVHSCTVRSIKARQVLSALLRNNATSSLVSHVYVLFQPCIFHPGSLFLSCNMFHDHLFKSEIK